MALAQEWQGRTDSGEARSTAELARRLGFSSTHVTQVLSLLLLCPQVQDVILAPGDPFDGLGLGIHTLRSLERLPVERQERWLEGHVIEGLVDGSSLSRWACVDYTRYRLRGFDFAVSARSTRSIVITKLVLLGLLAPMWTRQYGATFESCSP